MRTVGATKIVILTHWLLEHNLQFHHMCKLLTLPNVTLDVLEKFTVPDELLTVSEIKFPKLVTFGWATVVNVPAT